jgi:DNA-binding NarL/FixJ family response regulator
MANPIIQVDNEIREMTSEELEEYTLQQSQAQAQETAANSKKEARESALAKLAALGLTEEEIAAL